MEFGFYHPDRGYWQTVGGNLDELLAGYPEGTLNVPLPPSVNHEWRDGEWVYVEPEPLRQTVLKSTVQARIIEAGKMDAAYAALTSNATYFARWFAPDRPVVYCDDPDAMMLVTAIGLDPSIILAP